MHGTEEEVLFSKTAIMKWTVCIGRDKLSTFFLISLTVEMCDEGSLHSVGRAITLKLHRMPMPEYARA